MDAQGFAARDADVSSSRDGHCSQQISDSAHRMMRESSLLSNSLALTNDLWSFQNLNTISTID
jgi:hypothetical protein